MAGSLENETAENVKLSTIVPNDLALETGHRRSECPHYLGTSHDTPTLRRVRVLRAVAYILDQHRMPLDALKPLKARATGRRSGTEPPNRDARF